jgi:hypothetical protein
LSLGLIARDAVPFLYLARQLVTAAADHIEVVIRESAPLLLLGIEVGDALEISEQTEIQGRFRPIVLKNSR